MQLKMLAYPAFISYSLLLLLANVMFVFDSANALGTMQSAGAKGKLLCKGQPYKDAKIKLWDIDTLDPDDLMAETRSDEHGAFRLIGNETEVTTIDPKINIYHNCEDENVECWRKIQIKIPQDYVSDDSAVPTKIFDAGVLNLSGVFPGESRDCIN